MPLLLTISNPAMSFIAEGDMTEDIKKQLSHGKWLSLILVSGDPVYIRIASIMSVQEISEEKKAEFERLDKQKSSVLEKAIFTIPKKRGH